MSKVNKIKSSKGEQTFDVLNIVLMIVVCFVTLYPIWYTVVLSFNDGTDALKGGIFWFPREFTLDNYKAVFRNRGIITAYTITIARTFIGTFINVFFTAMVAYAFSKKDLIGRKYYIALGTFTMFFGGGLIPLFLLLKSLQLLDTFMVYIIPTMFNFFNLLIFMSFFSTIPASLEESAKMDGANDLVVFLRIVLPLSKPVLATIALFTGVWHWNDYFFGVVYINKSSLQPIQTYLYKIVAEAGSSRMAISNPVGVSKSNVTSNSIKYATMVVTTLPIVLVYPFLQKYFVKGVMLGAVKG
jgi:putative aldouronate transport system permease protein